MFVIEKTSNTYTVVCNFTPKSYKRPMFLYAIRNLKLDDVAHYMLGRSEDIDGEITDLFKYTNITKAYVSDTGRVSAVHPL
jgi:hypothetical protein